MSGMSRKRLAIVGGGSSGLICLKYALDLLPQWEIRCFEKSDRITGAWGNPYPGFVSTSTKYTTQFACFAQFDASVAPDGGASRAEFFRNGEYGEYLTRFAEEFRLREHIELGCQVERIGQPADGLGWELQLRRDDATQFDSTTERFDAVVICTGLAAQPKQLDCDLPTLSLTELASMEENESLRRRRIVVVGGGESAVDVANRLAREELQNEVYLSLKSGVRVSPRYHPICGVPSDFLRNRLMLSIHEGMRNAIGQRFVEMRIRYQETLERLFPGARRETANDNESSNIARRKDWCYRLTKSARNDLFNMFHNKSDDFLDAVADGRITIVGPPLDRTFRKFRGFDHDSEIDVDPELVAPSIGYHSKLAELTEGEASLSNFYLACCHVRHDDLFLVGFARPVIGNIPSISEMQARLVCSMLAGIVPRPADIAEQHERDLAQRKARFHTLDLEHIYPVEMFPYCDRLAALMNVEPSGSGVNRLRRWKQLQLAPATTMHYRFEISTNYMPRDRAPVYMPTTLVSLLLALKPIDWVYRLFRR